MRALFFVIVLFNISSATAFTVSLDFDAALSLNKDSDPNQDAERAIALGSTSGHEEITRQAMNIVRKKVGIINPELLKAIDQWLGDFEPQWFGTRGSYSHNLVVKGNYATDFPDGDIGWSVREYWNIAPGTNWHENPDGQDLHFLRNYVGTSGLASAKDSCKSARNRIIKLTVDAVDLWKTDRPQALFLIGHATHILQDSFSPAHTRRSRSEMGNTILDLCYYGADRKQQMSLNDPSQSACYHQPLDKGDFIWIDTPGKLDLAQDEWLPRGEQVAQCMPILPFEDSKQACLKHEARLARTATAQYLYFLARYHADRKLSEVRGKIFDPALEILRKRLMDLFEGPGPLPGLENVMARGFLRCDDLGKTDSHVPKPPPPLPSFPDTPPSDR